MITGDYLGTAMSVVREVGLNCEAGVITGPKLGKMSDLELAERIKSVSIFARMVPEQKLRLVRALRLDGEVVGMTITPPLLGAFAKVGEFLQIYRKPCRT